jgi:hypothetical protein
MMKTLFAEYETLEDIMIITILSTIIMTTLFLQISTTKSSSVKTLTGSHYLIEINLFLDIKVVHYKSYLQMLIRQLREQLGS